jgi:hypothetical protein
MKPSLTTATDGISNKLKLMIDRGKSMQTFLNRNIYKMYQNAQRERWMSKNESEGSRWLKLDSRYAKYKREKYAAYEGAGTKILIATGALFHAAIGPAQGQRKIVTNSKLYISTAIPYAGYVNEARNFTKWGSKTMRDINKAIKDFVFFNIKRGEA